MQNGYTIPNMTDEKQIVECGAVVQLNEVVLSHGVIIMHPDMPLIRLVLSYDKEKKIIDKYNFELVKPESDKIKSIAVVVLPPPEEQKAPEAKLLVPKKGLLGPNGEPL